MTIRPCSSTRPSAPARNEPVDHRAARGAPAELVAREGEPLVAHAATVAGRRRPAGALLSFAPALPALIVSYSAGPGGAERILADHATALGDDTCVACPDGMARRRARGPVACGCSRSALAPSISGPGRSPPPRTWRGTLARCAAWRATCARTWWWRGACARCSAAPPRGLEAPLVFQHNDLLPGPAVARAVRAAAARCRTVIALSQAIADDLGRGRRAGDPPRRGPRALHARGRRRAQPSALFLGAPVPWKRARAGDRGHAPGGRAARAGGRRRERGSARDVRGSSERSAARPALRVLPRPLRRPRAVRPGARGGAGLWRARGGAGGRRPGRDRRAVVRPSLPARRRARRRAGGSRRCCATARRCRRPPARARSARFDLRGSRRAFAERSGHAARRPAPARGSRSSPSCTTPSPSSAG